MSLDLPIHYTQDSVNITDFYVNWLKVLVKIDGFTCGFNLIDC